MQMTRTVLGAATAAVCLACAGTGAAQSGAPDSVSATLTRAPTSFTQIVRPGRVSTNRVEVALSSACRSVSFLDHPLREMDTNAYVLGIVRDDLKTWLGSGCEEDYPEGATWTDTGPVFRATLRYGVSDPSARHAPIVLDFAGRQAVLARVSVKRIRTWTRKVTRPKTIHYRRRVWDYEFDRYINICINGNYRIYASGGNLYCNAQFRRRVYRKVKVVTKAKIRWSVVAGPGTVTITRPGVEP